MRQIVLTFNAGDVQIETGDCTLAEITFASKLLDLRVNGALAMQDIKTPMKQVIKAVEEIEQERANDQNNVDSTAQSE